MSDTNSIHKKVVLRASPARVWRALSDAREFGAWFGVALEGEFVEGASIFGKITHPGYEHVKLEMQVERIEPEKYFAYRWHPHAIDPKGDYAAEPTTLVEFRIEPSDGATVLTIVESGFDKVPAGRRAEAFRMNDGGWGQQIENIGRHVAQP